MEGLTGECSRGPGGSLEGAGRAAGDPVQVGASAGWNEATGHRGRAPKGERGLSGSGGGRDAVRRWDVL